MTERIIATFARVARPIMRKWMTPNSCIASARVTIETMKLFNLRAEEIPVSYVFQVPARKYARISGFSGKEQADMKCKATTWRDELPEGLGWNGHLLVLVEDRWVLDPSIDQMASRGFRVEIPEEVFVIDTAGRKLEQFCQIELRLILDDGHNAALMYRRIPDLSYRESEAWTDEGLPILADEIAMQMAAMWAVKQQPGENCGNT